MSVYEGKLPYIFISYAHKNDKEVMRIVDALERRGYRVWFDAGITPGSEWPENIAQHLADCAAVIAVVTPEAMKSSNCRREIHFALSREKPLLSVYLEKTELPLGMELQLAAQQSILRYNYRTEAEFLDNVCACEMLLPCLIGPDISPGSVDGPEAPRNGGRTGRRKVLAIAAAAVCVTALLAGGFFLRRSGGNSEPQTAPTETAVPRTEIPKEQKPWDGTAEETEGVHYMRPAEKKTDLANVIVSEGIQYEEAPFWGQTEYRRSQVKAVRFQGTMEGAPASAWDISEGGDGSVLAWMEGGTLRVAADGKIACRDASYLFFCFGNLASVDWGGCFDTSKTTTMKFMFYACGSLKVLDVTGFDTARVTDMSGMFLACHSLTALDVTGFDTSKVTDMSDMFGFCDHLAALDVSGFDTANVVNMKGMFDSCVLIKTLDLSGFDTSKVTNMASMFRCCYALTDLDVSGFDVSKVSSMEDMFRYCIVLPKSAIPAWYTG